jgi:hypothetical protein
MVVSVMERLVFGTSMLAGRCDLGDVGNCQVGEPRAAPWTYSSLLKNAGQFHIYI